MWLLLHLAGSNVDSLGPGDAKAFSVSYHALQFLVCIECGIIGKGSQISTNQERESTVFSFLIG